MSRTVTVAAIQTSYGQDMAANIAKTEHMIRNAAQKGAQVILPSELFQNIYFCTTMDDRWFAEAYPLNEHPAVRKMQALAKAIGVVIPTSFFERDGDSYYNSVAVVDHEGEIMGIYRKSHIPDGPGYEEKYYFKPGNTGYKVWKTKFGTIGVGICWDQWFPECARAMALLGAEVLFYPTAIGSEPHDAGIDTCLPWQRVMQGHAVANSMPVVAANRVGIEKGLGAPQNFYGSSFIADHKGALVESFDRSEQGVLIHSFDLDFLAQYRHEWGCFRDLRADID